MSRLHGGSAEVFGLIVSGTHSYENRGGIMQINDITMSGNLVFDPDFTGGNDKTSRVKFRLANTPRRFDSTLGRWADGETTFIDVVCWRSLADNVIASVAKGSSVIVTGHLRSRSVQVAADRNDPESAKRNITFYEIEATSVGLNLARGPARHHGVKGPGAARQEERALAEVTAIVDGQSYSSSLPQESSVA
jgi:single-strand DNA-binding protein